MHIMTTIVNTPAGANESNGGTGVIIGILILIVIGFLFFYYGLPAIRSVQLGTPQINVPAKIDVNVNQPTP